MSSADVVVEPQAAVFTYRPRMLRQCSRASRISEEIVGECLRQASIEQLDVVFDEQPASCSSSSDDSYVECNRSFKLADIGHVKAINEDEDDDGVGDEDIGQMDDDVNDEEDDVDEDDLSSGDAETHVVRVESQSTPFQLQDFKQMCTIGTGTFGRVILVQHQPSEQFFALKQLSIQKIIRTKQVQHVHSEKHILESLSHPFIVTLHWSHIDRFCLYMLFDFVPGGELFAYLRSIGSFRSPVARFYSAEIVLALEYLHKKHIVYRDLKPENLLLDRDGHLRITDFGFAKKLFDRTWTLCGTPEYLAPEVIENHGHNTAVDWWSFGILIYEMLAGYPPFRGQNALEIYDKVCHDKPRFPRQFDLVAKDLIKKFLVSDRTKRLGNMKNGADDVKQHKWFSCINWDEVLQREVKPPIVPKVLYDGDPGNFDEYDEDDADAAAEATLSEMELFSDW